MSADHTITWQDGPSSSRQPEHEPPSNPFSTRFVRPGAIPFAFPSGYGPDPLIDRLATFRWCGQIVGPHGSGKSTLLATLLPRLAHRRRVAFYRVAPGRNRLGVSPEKVLPGPTDAVLVVIDGFEQLAWYRRLRWIAAAQSPRSGLLVSCHRRQPLPLLWRTRPTVALLQQLVERLTAADPRQISAADVQRAFAIHPANVREALFRLYDLYERRRPTGERLLPSSGGQGD